MGFVYLFWALRYLLFHLLYKKAIDTHFTSTMDSADSQNYYWTEFLYCIIDLQPSNVEEYKTYMKILKQILCDEQNYSNSAITLPVSNYSSLNIKGTI